MKRDFAKGLDCVLKLLDDNSGYITPDECEQQCRHCIKKFAFDDLWEYLRLDGMIEPPSDYFKHKHNLSWESRGISHKGELLLRNGGYSKKAQNELWKIIEGGLIVATFILTVLSTLKGCYTNTEKQSSNNKECHQLTAKERNHLTGY